MALVFSAHSTSSLFMNNNKGPFTSSFLRSSGALVLQSPHPVSCMSAAILQPPSLPPPAPLQYALNAAATSHIILFSLCSAPGRCPSTFRGEVEICGVNCWLPHDLSPTSHPSGLAPSLAFVNLTAVALPTPPPCPTVDLSAFVLAHCSTWNNLFSASHRFMGVRFWG